VPRLGVAALLSICATVTPGAAATDGCDGTAPFYAADELPQIHEIELRMSVPATRQAGQAGPHDPSKCREPDQQTLDGDCCGNDDETWCADGYCIVHQNGGSCGDMQFKGVPKNYVCLRPMDGLPCPPRHTAAPGYHGSFQELVAEQSDEFFGELNATIVFNGVAHPGGAVQVGGGAHTPH
jgi:hypothetical protein